MKHLYNRVDKKLLKAQLSESTTIRKTLSFYSYAKIRNPKFFRDHLYYTLSQHQVLGRIYVASEGVNGQLSVPEIELDAFKESLYEIDF